jgi:hypothetical protein
MIGRVTADDISGTYVKRGMNGMSWDTYWNGGSPVRQSRYYDDLTLSTEPVGPARTPLNPVVVTGALRDPDPGDSLRRWEVEIAEATQEPLETARRFDRMEQRPKDAAIRAEAVWKGSAEGRAKQLTVDSVNGTFVGTRAGMSTLAPNRLHLCRIRHQDAGGNWSEWSRWHCGFATTWAEGTPPEKRTPPEGYYLGGPSDDSRAR